MVTRSTYLSKGRRRASEEMVKPSGLGQAIVFQQERWSESGMVVGWVWLISAVPCRATLTELVPVLLWVHWAGMRQESLDQGPALMYHLFLLETSGALT
ncbi:uncharacterized protein ACWYII_000285 isoform 2-T2 [Salvelinus alpinus]